MDVILLLYVPPSAQPYWGRGRNDLQQAGVGRVTARDGGGLLMRGGLAGPGAAERARAEHLLSRGFHSQTATNSQCD